MNIVFFEKHEVSASLSSAELEAGDSRVRHIIKILKKGAGESFDAAVVDGRSGRAALVHIDKNRAFFSLELDRPPRERLPVEIALGFPRPIQLRRILRSLSSMGAGVISVFGTELGEKSYMDSKLFDDGGARAALIEGAAQGRDSSLPRLKRYSDAASYLAGASFDGKTLISADNINPSGTFFELPPSKNGFVIAVGSERGWSSRERTLFESRGFLRLSLGSRALRTEDAAIAAAVFAGLRLPEAS